MWILFCSLWAAAAVRTSALPARRVLEENKDVLEYDSIEVDDNVAKISLVGAGMMTHVGVASDMFFGNED